ncbi:MAG: hypothetical protein IKP99_07630 [Bacteroidales bacterium]|nr:hypothetical protein [Bacteroidales bacterium]
MKKYLFIVCFACFTCSVFGQWTFTMSLQTSGNCEGSEYAKNIFNSQASSIWSGGGLPTKAQCEQVRSQILAIRSNTGDCTMYFTCSECTGSDMNMGGSSSNLATRTEDAAAQLNQMGLEYGQAYHSPSAVEDVSAWLNEYQLKLENGNGEMQSFTINTGDVDYEKAYAQEVESIGATVREEPSDYVWGTIDPNYLKQFNPEVPTKTTGQGRGVKLVDTEYMFPEGSSYSLKDSEVPKPVSDWDPNVIEHPAIDAVTEVALLTSETLLDGGTKYFADLNINLYSELAKAADEGLHHQKVVTTGEIWENTLSNTAKIMIDDAKEKVEGFIQPFVNPEQYAKDQITGMVSEKVTSTITEKGVVKALTISGIPITQDYKDNAGKTIYGTKTTGINIVNNAIKTLNYIDKVKEIHQNYKTRTEYMGK